ncbi:glutathione synthase/RimK-type ligase-like ATP-grasp enzyme [Brevibacterium sanguinis]|uniref:Glutathione synthase/RimK-type ligase-like ATP-grasp enzyme n=2 Tax=Brevibacterium TaxID=1696 RepID=A0A366IMR0_9MICO|nr:MULTISPECIES: alpha-L-glutamate ligase [Brevibacterium]RBP66214.1 glutathione synthase/RimK-type ligase-like ATP-grasp enzyme [Brevibacterium sanguinis]RBP72865.1 glutathione synthase/RimK-type ligase-like ATP-grasp enzyme [Brevibacterium celere]
MSTVHVIHDNPDWLPPFRTAFAEEGVDLEEWLLGSGSFDLGAEPPEGVFWSRLSASSHTRTSEHVKDFGRAVLTWLESHGRTVVNGRSVLELEMSKIAQYAALGRSGIAVPRTAAVFGTDDLLARSRAFAPPFISKHNQGGKGLGVRRFDDHDSFAEYVASADFDSPVDGITLLQEFVASAGGFITRAEFVGGEFVYAVRVDTTSGGFELCPADACAVPGAPPLFSLREDAGSLPIIAAYSEFLGSNGIGIAGIEFIETADGSILTYDVNTNTNYNPEVEAEAPRSGPREIARYLGALAS